MISLGATELVWYDLETGKKKQALEVAGGGICAASFDLTDDGIGAVLSGDRCTKVTTVDTRTGKEVWSVDSGLDNPSNGHHIPRARMASR